MPKTTRPTPAPPAAPTPTADGAAWTFLSNHAHVIILLATQQNLVLREVAQRVGITERAVQRIVADLAADGFLTVGRQGRRNTYTVAMRARLRHPIEAHRCIADLVALGS